MLFIGEMILMFVFVRFACLFLEPFSVVVSSNVKLLFYCFVKEANKY
jgi:hypothetical protein